MTVSLWCPICKRELQQNVDKFNCETCNASYPILDGYVDFMQRDFYAGEFSRDEALALLANIDKLGYDTAMDEFFLKYPHLKNYILENNRADWQCHCVGGDFSRALDIGSGLGNISDILSNNFEEVYSLEAVPERIKFQKRRFGNSTKNNIVLVRANAMKLPFPENFFDLVVCNGVLEWVAQLNPNVDPRKAQISFLTEIKRVLSPRGCAYIGIENRMGLPFILGAPDHSGLRYTSLMPRRLASFLVKRYGRIGGVYGDSNQREKRGYITYTYTLSGYKKLFNEIGFKIKSFWVFPSYNEPIVSGRTQDSTALKGYLRQFVDIYKKYRIPISLLYRFDKSIIRVIGSLFTPSFLFFCYKNEIPESFDDVAVSKTALSSFVRSSTGTGVMYTLYDEKAKPSRVLHLERPECRPTDEIPFRDKSKPELTRFEGKVWIENWIDGKRLNPLNFQQSQHALRWLFEFQSKGKRSDFTKDEIKSRADDLKTKLSLISEISIESYSNLFDEYKSYLSEMKITKTPEHGDFFYGNIIVEDSNSTIQVIDWEYYRDDGDPFFDLMFYIVCAMQLPRISDRDFKNNLDGNGKFINILKALKPMIDNYYGYNIDLNKLLPYAIIRFFVRKYIERGKYDDTVLQFKKLLDIVSSREFKLNV